METLEDNISDTKAILKDIGKIALWAGIIIGVTCLDCVNRYGSLKHFKKYVEEQIMVKDTPESLQYWEERRKKAFNIPGKWFPFGPGY